MGGLGQVMVTGAAGFIGSAIVAEARRAGLRVVAVTRHRRLPGWDSDEGISVLNADLADPDAIPRLRRAIDDCETVIHAAASLSGDARAHVRDTLTATQLLLTAMRDTQVQRFVLLSSIAVYDMSQLNEGDTLSEATPLEQTDTARDAYTRAKLRQEEMCRQAAAKQGLDLWVLRPGAVFGPGRLWNGHLGIGIGPALLRFGAAAWVPVCHIDTCAKAVVLAAQNSAADLPEVNLLESILPTRADYVTGLRRLGWPKYVISLPVTLLRLVGTITAPLGTKRPGLFRPPVIHARLGSFEYDNARQCQRFGAPAPMPFDQLVEKAAETEAGT